MDTKQTGVVSPDQTEQRPSKSKHDNLPMPWQRIQGAVWLIGLALLAYFDWWWPGILLLVAISGLVQAAIQFHLNRRTEELAHQQAQTQLAEKQANWLPARCPNCGAPLSMTSVKWTGPLSADCPYCSTHLKAPAEEAMRQ